MANPNQRTGGEQGQFTKPPLFDFETVAVSQTGQVLGARGATGDLLQRVIISVITVATATVTIIDGSTSIIILTGAAGLVAGVYSVELGIASTTGAWSITTGAGATVIAVGLFS